jgi:hypothetical protein
MLYFLTFYLLFVHHLSP